MHSIHFFSLQILVFRQTTVLSTGQILPAWSRSRAGWIPACHAHWIARNASCVCPQASHSPANLSLIGGATGAAISHNLSWTKLLRLHTMLGFVAAVCFHFMFLWEMGFRQSEKWKILLKLLTDCVCHRSFTEFYTDVIYRVSVTELLRAC